MRLIINVNYKLLHYRIHSASLKMTTQNITALQRLSTLQGLQ